MSNVLGPRPLVKQTPAIQPVQDDHRDFGDVGRTRQGIYGSVLDAVKTMPPVQNSRHTLRLINPEYVDPEKVSRKKHKEAILSNKTLGRRIRGTWELVDNESGGILDSRQMTVAKVPHMTDHGTFVHNGNEYSVINQLRLRPGSFTRVKDNGEIETHANILPGRGVAHRYHLDPEKGVFKMRIGQANIPLFPLLKAMGVTDGQFRESWGNELYSANAQKDNPAALNKLYTKLVSARNRDENADVESKSAAVTAAMEAMEMDPDVNVKTLGKPYKNMNVNAIMDITKKLLAVSRGEAEVDDRDHLAYQTVHGPEDLFKERLIKDYGRLRAGLLHKAGLTSTLKHVTPGTLNKQLNAVLLSSGLGQSLEEINPSEIFDKASRISRLGEGGIPSIDAVPDEARSVQPSHFGFIDPVRTPESFRVGVDTHMASTVRKGKDGRVYSPFIDPKTNKKVWRSPQDLSELTVAFPGEMARQTKRIGAMQKGKLRFVHRNDVDLVLPTMENAFSSLGNMVPMKSAVKAQRMAMASRMLTQSLPLTDRESPHVQTGIFGDDGNSYEKKFGTQMGAIRADQPGKVVSVNVDSIKVKYADGKTNEIELYNHHPYNRKTYIHNTPTVKPGDTFDSGSLLAASNFTDKNGETALGLNARVAYIPFRGLNFEDANVISESMAQRLSSEHMYQKQLEVNDDYKVGKKNYVGMFANKYDKKILDTLDEDGIIKEGSVINYDDPIILAAKKRDTAKNKIHRKRESAYSDQSKTWDHHSQGIVTDVYKGDKSTTVLIKSISPMQIGDKLSGRYGDKGIISAIVPDDEMPKDKDGNPFEVLLNPLGIISRTNPAQMVEAALGKIAAKTGKKYNITDFEDIDDLTQFAIDELKKNKMEDLEDIIDPETDRKIKGVFTGSRFFMKLHHTAEGKGQGRGTGGYTMDETPSKGGATGSKRISLLDNNALLSMGATEVLRDAGAIRGQRNEEFWVPFLQGVTPPPPKVPFVYKKFVNQLKAAGINVVKQGTQNHIMALTNKDVTELAGGREVMSGETVKFDEDLTPIKGGLFDPKITGGHNGNRWSAIKLHEPMPNPVMEEPIRRLLGLTQKKFEAILSGEEELPRGGTGPKAIQKALGRINIDKELEEARAAIKGGRKTHRDTAVRKLGYLKSAKKLGIHPKDWMLDRVPVLPPAFRPVSLMSDKKLPMVSDPNYLYKELLEANGNLADLSKDLDDVGEERLAVYQAFKAVTGLGDPVHPKLQEKNVKGVLKHVFGSSPKMGDVQRRLVSSTVDLVGRAVISPNPDLDMDHVGLPENRAWDVYSNFIARRLKRRGMPISEALKQVKDRTALARKEMLAEMDERPVIINRAPVLHRFGIMAFKPVLTKGEVLQVSPLIVGGFGADFDGDAMQYHVPVSDEARKEAMELMLPSRNLISPADFKTPVHKPSQEYTGGLYAASATNSGRKPRTFRNIGDVRQAYRRGEIDINDPVKVLE
jgi:DNA-directed RNA polymerase subunit beta